MSSYRLVLFAFLAFGWAFDAVAQERIVLTLEETVSRAQSNSPRARMARLQFQRSDWDYRSFRADYMPGISLTGSAPGLIRSISDVQQDDGSVRYVSQSRTFSSVNMAITQPIPLTGGSVFLQSGLSRIDLFGQQSSNQWQSSPLVVGLFQPIFQFNQMRWDRAIQPLQFEAAHRRYAEDLAEVAVDITSQFFDVVIAQMNVERAEFNVAVNDTIYILSQGRFDIGRIAENDLLQSELALLNAQTELSDLKISYDRALQELKTALDLPYNAEVTVVAPFEAPAIEVNPEVAVAQSRRNRAAYVEMDVSELEAERELARARSTRRLSANLNASYGLNQSSDSIDDVYRNPLNQQRLQVGFSVPLYHWGKARADVESAAAERDRILETSELREKELQQDVYFEALRLAQLRRQLDLSAKADTIATRRFQVARSRYTIGKIDITELFIAQQAKDAANQAYIRTLQQFWFSYFRLRHLTLFDFQTGRALVER